MQPPELSTSLFTSSPSNKSCHGLKAFLKAKGHALQVFGLKEEDEGRVVSGYCQGAVGEAFEVGFYDGREKKSTEKGHNIKLRFGDEWIAGFYEKPGEIAAVHARAKDDKQRFWTCKERRVSEDHVRPFTFSKVPTTDQADQADDNLDFLNTISVIKLEYWFVKQAPAKKKDEKDKGKKKAAPKASTSTYTDPLANVDERAINENSDKGQFALNPGYGDLVVKPKELSTSGSSAQWKYVTISKKPDLTLIFRIRSRVWIENFLNHDFPPPPRSPYRSHQIGNELYVDMDDEEAAAAALSSASIAAATTKADEHSRRSATVEASVEPPAKKARRDSEMSNSTTDSSAYVNGCGGYGLEVDRRSSTDSQYSSASTSASTAYSSAAAGPSSMLFVPDSGFGEQAVASTSGGGGVKQPAADIEQKEEEEDDDMYELPGAVKGK